MFPHTRQLHSARRVTFVRSTQVLNVVRGLLKKTIDFEKRWRPSAIHGLTLQVYFLDEQMNSAENAGEK